ncbi:putative ATP-dependent helicase IRC3 [Friedmanniomyces endolithicus]|nr:putative ATP-dependent helicase IRC3 [Friedmanniomyces endolithicus]KAK0292446.1 putative ATP-dependent helicase IRC3 [Friedmanniomyces endolithicus]KAK0998391.1 putative ATP-dependent helicase IRC3 [Friedmanniomyces endolithicus]
MRCLRLLRHGSDLIQGLRYRPLALAIGNVVSCLRFTHLPATSRAPALAGSRRQDGETNPPATSLRPYQEDIIQAVLAYLAKGEKRLGISLATGGGKTVIFSHLIDRIPPPTSEATQTLIVAHKAELVHQAVAHCRRLYPSRSVEVEMAGESASGEADITVASVQTLNSKKRLEKFEAARFKLVVVDEVHHVVAPSYLNVLRHFGLVDGEGESRTALIGMSATLSRSDGLSLGKAIDHIVYHKDYLAMIEEDWLSNVIFTTVKSAAKLDKVKTGKGDFQLPSLSKAVNTPEVNSITVRAWLQKAEGRKSTLVFAVDLAHVAALAEEFRKHGVDARSVTGNTDQQVRKDRVQAFRDGEFPVLLNCGVFTEGTDIPNIDCILLARPTRSRNLLVQMVGRGLRLHAGKENCHVIDMVSALESGIVTTPTLFGLDPDELVDKADAAEMKLLKDKREIDREAAAKASTTSPSPDTLVFTDYDNVYDLIQDTTGESHIRSLSPFAWVRVDTHRHVLSSSAGDITLTQQEAEGSTYLLEFLAAIPPHSRVKSPFMRRREIGRAHTFEQAVRAGDTFAKEKFVAKMISTRAPWRGRPASASQVAFLNGFLKGSEGLVEGAITKGKAADWITKSSKGAKGRFKKIEAGKRREGRVRERKEEFERRSRGERVGVGPVDC